MVATRGQQRYMLSIHLGREGRREDRTGKLGKKERVEWGSCLGFSKQKAFGKLHRGKGLETAPAQGFGRVQLAYTFKSLQVTAWVPLSSSHP